MENVEVIEAAELGLAAAIDALTATQRELDALQARRARELVVVIEQALAVETAVGHSTGSQRQEFARRSARAEIALALGVGERTADRISSEAETLVYTVPAVLTAVEQGAISWPAARTIALEAGTLDAQLRTELGDGSALRERLERFEAGAIELARRVATSRLRGRLEALRERVHPVAAEVRHAAARAERHVTLEDLRDGMSWLRALLPAVEAHAIMGVLTGRARAGRDAEDRIAGGAVDGRTLDQRRADLLVDYLVGDRVRIGDADLADVSSVNGDSGGDGRGTGREFARFAGIRPTVVVTVPVQSLLPRTAGLGEPQEPAMLDGIVPIDPATARALTGSATTLYRLLVDPHTGARLDLSRDRYQVTADMRMWLRLRDEHCRFPGCGRAAHGCDIDHTVDWQYGGATRADNLAHLCRGHHTLKHQASWRVSQDTDGSLTWRAPSGTIHETAPPNAFLRRV